MVWLKINLKIDCITALFQISTEVAKLPQSRFLPRPPGHDKPLKVEFPKFQAKSSVEWIKLHGLKGMIVIHVDSESFLDM